MANQRRVIEFACPLKPAWLDSVHETNVRHGHMSATDYFPLPASPRPAPSSG
jgi:hypothetical protein